MPVLIRAENLYKTFDDECAVCDINLQISSGEIFGLVGPDGAGKTTTMRLLCGAYLPDIDRKPQSIIEISGFDVLQKTEQARSKLGYLPQRFSLYEDLTVLENIRFFAEVRGLSESEWKPRSMEILEFVGLDTFVDRRAGNLSGGMKQKLGLAAALVHRPQVLLLDEPTTGVDPVTRQDFWQLLIKLAGGNNIGEIPPAVLISTPYMDEAARCSRIGFMANGKIVREGMPSYVRETFVGNVLELSGEPLKGLRQIAKTVKGVKQVQMFGDRLHVHVKPGKEDKVSSKMRKKAQKEGVKITMLREISPQLEDVFIQLMETNGQ
jgi:ABC-2 type transport system ATP-binding protein